MIGGGLRNPLVAFFWRWGTQQLNNWGATALESNNALQQPILSADEIIELGSELDGLGAKYPPNFKQSDALRQGEQSSRFMGSGMEYEESRPYQQGDEIRRINWKLMAKTGQAYTKLYQEERQESWFILLDHRQSMRFGTRKRLKATQASRVAGYYAWLAQQAGIPISIARLTDSLQQSPIFEGRSSFSQIMQIASQACPVSSDSATLENSPSLGNDVNSQQRQLNEVLLKMSHQLPKGSRFIIISDFQDVSASTQEILTALQAHILVKAVLIQDSSEVQLPNLSGVQLQSTETGEVLSLNGTQQNHYFKSWSVKYFKELAARFETANAQFYKVQADYALPQIKQALEERASLRQRGFK